jgi:hypothetical protein
MAAPAPDYVILPLDTGNTGKKVRTQTRTVNSQTVHEHYFISTSARSVVGKHRFTSGILTHPATAHNATSTGHIWFINPVGTANKIAIEKLAVDWQLSSNTTSMTPSRLVAALFTFTGTASGATITPGKLDSTFAATNASIRTAITGMTVTLGAGIGSSMAPTTVGTAGWTPFQSWVDVMYFNEDENSNVVLRAGEGLVLYAPDTSVASDTRRCSIDCMFSEFE